MSKGFKEPKTIHIQPVYQPAPMPIPKHIHYIPPAGATAPLVHVSSYSPFAPTTPVSYASMPGAPIIPHSYTGSSSSSSSSAEHHAHVTPPTGASSSSSTPVAPLSASEMYVIEHAKEQQVAQQAADVAWYARRETHAAAVDQAEQELWGA